MPAAMKTKPEVIAKPEPDQEDWENAPSTTLPPFCILEIGNTATGVLLSRDEHKEEKKVRGKLVTKLRIMYRLRLTSESQGLNGGKKTGVSTTYPAGTVVSIPGAGALDKSIDLLALKVSNKDLEGEVTPQDYQSLLGREFKITRMEDGTMKGGDFKGNPVKVYDIKHRSLKA